MRTQFLTALAGLALACGGAAQSLSLAADINSIGHPDPSSSPGRFTVNGKLCVFSAWTPGHGNELWITDGTRNGTRELIDIVMGPGGSRPEWITAFGSGWLFTAEDGVHGRELWFTDGTAQRTSMVVDLEPGANSKLQGIYGVANGLAFLANGGELYVSDGTARGTRRVPVQTNGFRAALPSNYTWLVTSKGLFFYPWTTQHGYELWFSDGTASGTRLLREFEPGTGSPAIAGQMCEFAGGVAHTVMAGQAQSLLVFSDGTVMGTFDLSASTVRFIEHLIVPPVVYRNRIYFVAIDSVSAQFELWVADAKANSATLVLSSPVGQPLLFDRMFVSGGKLWLARSTTAHGLEWWMSDGTAAGTRLAFEIEPGPGTQQLHFGCTLPGGFCFFRTVGLKQMEFWFSDGTLGGTKKLADASPKIVSWGRWAFPFGSRCLYLHETATDGAEPYVSDGTVSGTSLLRNIALPFGIADSKPHTFAEQGGRAFFVADDGRGGWEPFLSMGSPNTSRQVMDIAVGKVGSDPRELTDAGGLLCFSALWPGVGREPVLSDGLRSGTRLLKDIHPGTASSDPGHFTSFRDEIWFSAKGPAGSGIWRSDGTSAGTQQVFGKPLDLTSAGGPLTVAGSKLYFSRSGAQGVELWVTDGTRAGARQVRPAGASLHVLPAARMSYSVRAVRGHELFFFARDSALQDGLWATDGSVAGTRRLGPVGFDLELSGGAVYWLRSQPIASVALWRTDGTASGTLELATIQETTNPHPLLPPSQLHGRMRGDLAFRVRGGPLSSDLWLSDGTAQGTRKVATLAESEGSILPLGERHVLFSGAAGGGAEPWITDGTSAGTRQIAEMVLGPGSSWPHGLGVASGLGYLSLTTTASGREPFVVGGLAAAAPSGQGCGPTGVRLATGDPVLGASMALELRHGAAGQFGLLLLGGMQPLPQLLSPGGCRLYVDPSGVWHVMPLLVTNLGEWRGSLGIPGQLSLRGLPFALQAFLVSSSWELSATQAVHARIGN